MIPQLGEHHRTLLQRWIVDDEHSELNDNIIELTGVDVIEESSKQLNGTTLFHRERTSILQGSRSQAIDSTGSLRMRKAWKALIIG